MAYAAAATPRPILSLQKSGAAYPTAYPLPPVRQNLPDDYERWYTEASATNRMLLSLRSGIPKEVNWALERMCRLSNNDQFVLKNIIGLTDALVEWPEWYIARGVDLCHLDSMFSMPSSLSRQKRHALEAIFILRNASLTEPNAQFLATHTRTLHMIRKALHRIKADSDTNSEFLLHVVDLAYSVISCLSIDQQQPGGIFSTASLIEPLERIVETSNDRALIITVLRTLTLIISNPKNVSYNTTTSPALHASIRYLPLLSDTPLVSSCLDHIYAHISHAPMVKSFLLLPSMPGLLKVLVTLLLREQQEELETVDLLPEPPKTAPAIVTVRQQCEPTPEELDRIANLAEPERSYEWMRSLFMSSDAEEVTQVEFWSLYRDTFSPRTDVQPLLSAADVIKNVTQVFPTAQAMVLPGQPQRFVIRGIVRKMVDVTKERFKCHWNRSTCTSVTFTSSGTLWTHVLEHLSADDATTTACQWGSCPYTALSSSALKFHCTTHIPSPEPPKRHPSQMENITLPLTPYPHPSATPTKRPIPPPPDPQLVFPQPSADPPSTSLTALLIIRVLFRASFASTDAAPRADEEHFGFPGVVEEDTEEEMRDVMEDEMSREKGRKAFTGVRNLIQEVRVRDPALMAWIGEIIDVSLDEKATNV
ncbi:hypothetical protein Clacol_003817 [Clathrus columnatus]|uniref:RFX-type winged-helix domain-containing protein n=1 Tax=Clathrus columnatus TaxID=1419009 RepID=A0AAV5AA35_9AGAM|nr:hypothetical protein Clacol_003817 [Clathrus columnatus]